VVVPLADGDGTHNLETKMTPIEEGSLGQLLKITGGEGFSIGVYPEQRDPTKPYFHISWRVHYRADSKLVLETSAYRIVHAPTLADALKKAIERNAEIEACIVNQATKQQ
jgi:hypothetical protein